MRAEKWRENRGIRPESEVITDAVASVTYPSIDGQWLVRWILAEQVGTVVARAVTLEPAERATPLGGVTVNLLRELRPSRAVADAAALMAQDPEERAGRDTQLDDLAVRFARRQVRQATPAEPEPRHVGRPRLPDEHLAAVAVAYLEELQRGRGVLRRLGERFLKTPETMRDQVRLARRRGFLTDAPKAGRKGAMPGPRLLEWMTTGEKESGDA